MSGRVELGPPDEASRQRIQQMENELKALQAEAAKNPARPTVAEMERELNQMVAARHGESEITRLERLVKWSLGLSLVLAIALSGLAVSNPHTSNRSPGRATSA